MKPKITVGKLSDFVPDPHNANSGSERGRAMLDDSLQTCGAGRSLLADKDGVLIAGSQTLEAAIDNGFEDAVVVETDGKTFVVVKRTDLDAADERREALALYDNRTSEVGLTWEVGRLAEMKAQGLEMKRFFNKREMEALFGEQSGGPDASSAAHEDRFCVCPTCGAKHLKA